MQTSKRRFKSFGFSARVQPKVTRPNPSIVFELFYYHRPSLWQHSKPLAAVYGAQPEKKDIALHRLTSSFLPQGGKKKRSSVIVQRAYSSSSARGDIRLWERKKLFRREAAVRVMIPTSCFTAWQRCRLWHTLRHTRPERRNPLGSPRPPSFDRFTSPDAPTLTLTCHDFSSQWKTESCFGFFRLKPGCVSKVSSVWVSLKLSTLNKST